MVNLSTLVTVTTQENHTQILLSPLFSRIDKVFMLKPMYIGIIHRNGWEPFIEI